MFGNVFTSAFPFLKGNGISANSFLSAMFAWKSGSPISGYLYLSNSIVFCGNVCEGCKGCKGCKEDIIVLFAFSIGSDGGVDCKDMDVNADEEVVDTGSKFFIDSNDSKFFVDSNDSKFFIDSNGFDCCSWTFSFS